MAQGRKTGGGSRKGVPNKLTKSAKEAFQFAFDKIGGPAALAKWAKNNQADFYKLFARLIPVDVTSGGEKLWDKLEVEVHHVNKPQD